jgi:16S rRNA (uracil1498-N3)-methyltransferase
MQGPAAAHAAAHVLVTNVEHPTLSTADRHHLERVLRLRPGTTITVGDGAGSWRLVELHAELSSLGPVHVEPMQSMPIVIGIALTKGEKPELAVQKLTELGVDGIVLFPSARSVVKWEGTRAESHTERLRRVAEAAVCQSRRAWTPSVTFLPSFAEALTLPGVALAAAGGEPYDPRCHRTVLVGPEGGWAPQEVIDSLPRVALGPHILRAETAAVAIAAIACATRYFPQ